MKTILYFLICFSISINLLSQNNDTITVQVFTFNDPSPEGWCAQYNGYANFPNDNSTYYKILMVQTLKCDEATKADTFPCGEWDYIWHTFIIAPDGAITDTFCIGSFITPYGKRLNLGGEKGWVWEYDVTDYAPLLKGKRAIITGNNQELLDLKFLFIKGKPVRNVISVQNIYPFGKYKYEYLADDSLLKAKEITLNKSASGYMLRARISGHGHFGPRNCCEWESKTHSYYANGEMLFRWNVWKDCGFNPIYPQGGTWPFDRAGWCPGTKVDEYDFELTGKVKPGETISFDYGIEAYSGNGEKDGDFQMTHQLFSYGPPNYSIDCAISDIIVPTDKQMYGRLNPACSNPVIMIENTGNNTIKNVQISFGFRSVRKSIFTWYGNLNFGDKQIITLPSPDWPEYNEELAFEAEIIKVNNDSDDNGRNNYLSTKIQAPPQFPQEFIVSVKTNDHGRSAENTLLISQSDGTVKFSFDDYTDSLDFFHKIKLEPGCYELKFKDEMEDGIMQHWWYWNSDKEKVGISGKVKVMSADMKNVLFDFPSDFGQELRMNFVVK